MIRHIRNSIWAITEGVGYPVLLLTATPIFLTNLGPSQFGLWSLLTTITSAGMIVSVGLSASIIKLVAEVAHTTELSVNPIVRGSIAVAAIAGGVLALATVTAMSIASVSLLSKMGSQQAVIATGATAAILLWVEQFDTVLSSFLKGAERFSLAARMEIGLKFFQILCCILVVIFFKEIMLLYITLIVTASIRLFAKALVIKSKWPNLDLRPSINSSEKILAYSKWGWIQGGGSLFFAVADRLIVGTTMGSVSLGYYSIATQFVAQLHSLTSSAFSIITPRISKHTMSGSMTPQFRNDIVKLIVTNISISSIGALLLLIFGPWLFRVWVGENVAAGISTIFPILVLSYFLLSISIVPYFFLNGIGQMKFIALVCISGGILSLIIGLILIPSHGLMGAAISRCMYSIVAIGLFLPLFSRVFSRRLDRTNI